MDSFSIRDIENLSGVRAHTIRIWEQRYSFLKPQRTNTNIRCYSNCELKKILNIALLNKFGYKISHIDRMSELEIRDKILNLSNAEAQQERIINELIQSMVDLELYNFEKTIDDHILGKGIEKTINRVIFPFLERIGILWVTDHIKPAQEHLVSNIIMQKLIACIEKLPLQSDSDKTVLLFLPEGEYHEIGLLYIKYLLRSRGIRTLYLGSSVPMEDVEFLVKLKNPDFLFTHLTCVSNNFSFDNFLTGITKKIESTPIIVSGKLANDYKKKIPSQVIFKHSLPEITEFIYSI
jgi:MerR family transcriptional regulator, light-induced transcriptional regulator